MYSVIVDNDEINFQLGGAAPQFGDPVVLAHAEQDILGGTEWYSTGYTVETLLSDVEFQEISAEVTEKVRDLLRLNGVEAPDDFRLADYHKFVAGDDSLHQKIIEVTRELRMPHFKFDFESFIRKVSETIGHPLKSANNASSEIDAFLIVRINRPQSEDYNPPHKDGYLPVWQRTVNLWVPIAGVSEKSALPVVAGSHLLPEDKIKRTPAGALLNGKPYRVPAIVEWNGEKAMTRAKVGEGEALIFSPLLIHGCAKNMAEDTTRVALELRLSSAT